MTLRWKPDPSRIENANITRFMKKESVDSYHALVQKSASDIEWFWNAALEDLPIQWYQKYDRLYDDSQGTAWTKWFLGGKTNIVLNCLDQHIQAGRGSQRALIWEGECGATITWSYAEIDQKVQVLAAALKGLGIEKGDSICLYMPMIPEMLIAFLASIKIGAVIVPIFSGFGPEPLAVRLENAHVKLVFTADGSLRRGKSFGIKSQCDQALEKAPSVQHVIVAKRIFDDSVPMQNGRDLFYDDLIKAHEGETCDTLICDAEDPCLILYTSGTTGKPKGCVHTHAGSLAQIVKEMAYTFDVKSEDLFFWVTDIGWMMGPWEIIGNMTLGSSFMIFEGAPNYPKPDRLWQMVETHQVNILGISPTAIRVLMKEDDEWVDKRNLSSLKTLGSTGEPWDPKSYQWFFEKVGQTQCPIMNISGGTELIGCLLAPLPIHEITEMSLQGPALGMDVDIFDDEGKSVKKGELGYLVCKKPGPSMTKGFLGDPQRYLDTYFCKWDNVWFHGDWAFQDEEGFWFIRGRADDTIKVSGRRTGPAEIESAAMKVTEINEAAAIGIPHEIKGEGIVVFLVVKAGILIDSALELKINEKITDILGKTLKPEKLHFVAALPKTRSGKIVRGLIKKKYLGKDLGDLSSLDNPQALDAIPSL